MKNVIDWEWVRSSDSKMEFTLTMGTTERVASLRTTGYDTNLQNVVKIPQVLSDKIEFVIIKLGCGCEWKATSQTEGVNRICDQHYIQDIIDDAESKTDNEGKDNADD